MNNDKYVALLTNVVLLLLLKLHSNLINDVSFWTTKFDRAVVFEKFKQKMCLQIFFKKISNTGHILVVHKHVKSDVYTQCNYYGF